MPEVRDALSQVTQHRARVLVITGAGRGFCAGQDLADRAVAPGGERVDLGESIERNYKPLIMGLRNLPLPVIAAVNGVAAGAGANIALACDLVIARKIGELRCRLSQSSGSFLTPVAPGPCRGSLGTRVRWASRCSRKSSLPNRRPRGSLIWRCVEDSELGGAVDELASRLAKAPTLGLARTKHAIYSSWRHSLRRAIGPGARSAT